MENGKTYIFYGDRYTAIYTVLDDHVYDDRKIVLMLNEGSFWSAGEIVFVGIRSVWGHHCRLIA